MKRTRNMILMVAALVILIGAYVVSSKLFQEDSDTEETTGEVETTQVVALAEDTITSINYNYNDSDVALVKKGSKWEYKDDKDFPLNETTVGSMAAALSNIASSRVITGKDIDLETFGLKAPQMTITFGTDSESHTIKLGTLNSTTDQYYGQYDDDGKVYMLASAIYSVFSYDKASLLEMDTMADISAGSIKSIQVVKGKDTWTYTSKSEEVEATTAAQEQETTTQAETDSDNTESTSSSSEKETKLTWSKSKEGAGSQECGSGFDTWLSAVTGMTFTSCVNYKYSDASVQKQYGFDNPQEKIILTYVDENNTEQTYEIRFGNTIDDGTYVNFGDSSQVLLINSDTAASILDYED